MSSPSPNRELAQALARKAREDLDALVVLSDRDNIADAVIGFHAQQAVEKALKAVLVLRGDELRRTHDLRFLIEQAAELAINLPDQVTGGAWLTPWAVELRYDEFLDESLDRQRALQTATAAVTMAEELVAS